MKYLITQEEFETLIGRGEFPDAKVPDLTVVWFSATWCGPCRAVDGDGLEEAFPSVNWLKCDVDQNTYTHGYCGLRSIPAFVAIKNKKIMGSLQSNDTKKIADWVVESFQ